MFPFSFVWRQFKVKKASFGPFALRMVEDELRRLPSKGWAEMIGKVYEVDPMLCPLVRRIDEGLQLAASPSLTSE